MSNVATKVGYFNHRFIAYNGMKQQCYAIDSEQLIVVVYTNTRERSRGGEAVGETVCCASGRMGIRISVATDLSRR